MKPIVKLIKISLLMLICKGTLCTLSPLRKRVHVVDVLFMSPHSRIILNDLSALEEEHETLWVEINNKAKKFLFCCL